MKTFKQWADENDIGYIERAMFEPVWNAAIKSVELCKFQTAVDSMAADAVNWIYPELRLAASDKLQAKIDAAKELK